MTPTPEAHSDNVNSRLADGMANRLFTSTMLHAFLDEMEIDATGQCLGSLLSSRKQINQGRIKW